MFMFDEHARVKNKKIWCSRDWGIDLEKIYIC